MILALQTIATIIGIGELLLALYFWRTNSGSRIRWTVGLVALSMGMWVLLNVLTSYTERTALTDALVPILFFSVVILFLSILHLCLEFPYPMFRVDRLHILLLYAPAAIFAHVLFFTNGIVRDYQLDPSSPGYVIPGDFYPVFAGLIAIGLVASISLLIWKARRTEGVFRRNVLLVLCSFLIPGLPGLYFVLTREAVGASYNSLITPIVSGVWLGITGYIVFRGHSS